MICFNCYNEDNFVYKKENKSYVIGEEIISVNVTNTYCSECGCNVFNCNQDKENLRRAYEKMKEKSDSDFLNINKKLKETLI
jgi:hypothetical protein